MWSICDKSKQQERIKEKIKTTHFWKIKRNFSTTQVLHFHCNTKIENEKNISILVQKIRGKMFYVLLTKLFRTFIKWKWLSWLIHNSNNMTKPRIFPIIFSLLIIIKHIVISSYFSKLHQRKHLTLYNFFSERNIFRQKSWDKSCMNYLLSYYII